MESVFLFQDGVYHFSKGVYHFSKGMPLWLENRFQDSEMEPFVFAMGGGASSVSTPFGITGIRRVSKRL